MQYFSDFWSSCLVAHLQLFLFQITVREQSLVEKHDFLCIINNANLNFEKCLKNAFSEYGHRVLFVCNFKATIWLEIETLLYQILWH